MRRTLGTVGTLVTSSEPTDGGGTTRTCSTVWGELWYPVGGMSVHWKHPTSSPERSLQTRCFLLEASSAIVDKPVKNGSQGSRGRLPMQTLSSLIQTMALSQDFSATAPPNPAR